MKVSDYMPRVSDNLLSKLLESSGAVLVEGAKWCGKTQSSLQFAKSAIYMQDPDEGRAFMLLADSKPSLLLEGNTPRLIDEWQMAPVLWDAVRYAVDKRGSVGQFILTGSVTPETKTMHTGTGRIARMIMRPMSLFESNESNGSVSIKELFDGKVDVAALSTLTIDKIAIALCRGGWPSAVKMKKNSAQVAINYVESIINIDISTADGVERSREKVRLLLQSLARNISTMATDRTIMDDIGANNSSITDKTLNSYLNVLQKLYVVEDVKAWQPSLRSKTAIRTASKRQFVDPSIASAVLRVDSEGLLKDFETFGLLFESLCTRDLRVYAQASDGDIFHYRDKTELESDLIIKLHDGRWAAVEVKLGSSYVDEAAKNLIKLKEKIDESKMRKPSFLMVITGGQAAYKRDDGVLVIPIGCLKD